VAGEDLADGKPRPRREGCRQQGGCTHTRQPTQNDLVTRSPTSQHAPRRARGNDHQRGHRPALPRNDRRAKGCKLGRTPARAAGGGPRRHRRQDDSDAGRKRTETYQTETDRGPSRQTEEGGKEGAAGGRRPLPGRRKCCPRRDEEQRRHQHPTHGGAANHGQGKRGRQQRRLGSSPAEARTTPPTGRYECQGDRRRRPHRLGHRDRLEPRQDRREQRESNRSGVHARFPFPA